MVIENGKVQLVEQNDMSHYGHVVFPYIFLPRFERL